MDTGVEIAQGELGARPEPWSGRFQFTGQAGEYFRIWIVNLCLTILTLGIYGAWAKVRTRRYFYQHTSLDSTAFEYTAQPMALLIGRLIVLAMGGLYVLVGNFFPVASLGVWVIFMFTLPFLIVRSISFNHRNTRWRNIRFKFHGSYKEAAKVYLGLPLLVFVTLGLSIPYQHARQHQFLMANTAFGKTRAKFSWQPSKYYRAYGLALGTAVIGGLLMTLFASAAAVFTSQGISGEATQNPVGALGAYKVVALMIGYFALYGLVAAIIYVRTTNYRFNHTMLGEVRFQSLLSIWEVIGLYLKCGLAVLLTLGLAYPWAAIQIARYRAEHLEVVAPNGFSTFQQTEEEAHRLGALADEAAVGFDIDFGF